MYLNYKIVELALFLLWVVDGTDAIRNSQHELTIIKKLIGDEDGNGYKLDVLPSTDGDKPVDVELGLRISQIYELNIIEQYMRSSSYLCLKWNDSRLQWTPNNFPNKGNQIQQVKIAASYIWTPNIAVTNSYETPYHLNLEKTKNSLVTVNSNGEAEWCPWLHIKSSCTIDVTYYPFDQQSCILKFMSMDYNANELELSLYNDKAQADLSTLYLLTTYDIVEVPAFINYYPDAIGQPPEPETDVTFYITLKRRQGGLNPALQLLLPLNILTFVSLMTFLLPVNQCGGRIIILLLSLISMIIIFWYVVTSLPPTSFLLPLIIQYILCLIGINFVSLIFTVIVVNLVNTKLQEWKAVVENLGRKDKEVPLPTLKWIKCGQVLDLVVFGIMSIAVLIGTLVFFRKAFPEHANAD